eukprot:2848914-Prymnesium_polylepis.1
MQKAAVLLLHIDHAQLQLCRQPTSSTPQAWHLLKAVRGSRAVRCVRRWVATNILAGANQR